MKRIFLITLLSLAFAGCDSGPADNNSNANAGTNANNRPAPTVEMTPAPSPEASMPAKAALKAGDKVKVTINGTSTEATVLSVDEKAGKVTVKIEGQSGEKTFAIGEVTKQ